MEALAALRHVKEGSLLVTSRARFGDKYDEALVDQLARRSGGSVVAVDGGVASQDVARMMQAFDAYERAIASTRTRSHKGDQNKSFGHALWGFRRSADGGQLVPEPDEQRVLQIIVHMRTEKLTLREIVEHLKKAKLVSRAGKPLGIARVHQLLQAIKREPRYERYRRILEEHGK
jgi:hypothetical protein